MVGKDEVTMPMAAFDPAKFPQQIVVGPLHTRAIYMMSDDQLLLTFHPDIDAAAIHALLGSEQLDEVQVGPVVTAGSGNPLHYSNMRWAKVRSEPGAPVPPPGAMLSRARDLLAAHRDLL